MSKRENKFRFFRELPTPKMIYPGCDFLINHLGVPYVISRFPNNRIEVNIAEIIPLQFTGFHDKKGKEIYEGDIVFETGSGNYNIEWINEGACFGKKSNTGFRTLQPFATYKVIGNIYENPELL